MSFACGVTSTRLAGTLRLEVASAIALLSDGLSDLLVGGQGFIQLRLFIDLGQVALSDIDEVTVFIGINLFGEDLICGQIMFAASISLHLLEFP